jgi:acetate kinase
LPILTVNAGSSSVKLSLVGDDDQTLAERELAAPRARVDPGELSRALDAHFAGADAVAHRIVHGGERYRQAVVVDAAVRRELDALSDLAPLHQPKSLAALDAVSARLPELPAVACFDTAFHGTLPPAAYTYALPERWRVRWGVRRFGFHGLSHSWIARRAGELIDAAADRARIVSCHLGAGASLCAIADGRSVDTTMGFTPLEGLMMATRSGSIDPGLMLWLLEREAVDEAYMATALEHESGLAGLAGDADMAAVLARVASGDGTAALAIDVYVHRLRAGIAAMAAALDGIDVLVFTGGVGEHAAAVRARTAAGLGFLNVAIDAAANETAGGDTEITADGSPVRTLVLRAREDLEMVRQTREALGKSPSGVRSDPDAAAPRRS